MKTMFKAAVVGMTLLGTLSAVEAMPVTSSLRDPATVTRGDAQVEKTVVIVRRRVVRPRVIIRRPPIVRRPIIRRPLVRALRRL